MQLVLALVSALVLSLSAAPVMAAVDCEPNRCDAAVQTDLGNCPCPESSNHGKYVSCIAHRVNQLARDGVIPTNCKGKITRCAARSTCGKPGFVVCHLPVDTCDLTTFTCTENPTQTCATDLDCGFKCKIKSTDTHCTDLGGTVDTSTNTCCAACGG
jgi:hypothetical protein